MPTHITGPVFWCPAIVPENSRPGSQNGGRITHLLESLFEVKEGTRDIVVHRRADIGRGDDDGE
jgi:hypothetical protein